VDHRKSFGRRVRTLRKTAKLTLEMAAEKAQLTGNYWGEVERSKKVPSLDTIVAMARALRVPAHVLLALEREEDERSLRKRIETLLDGCDRKRLDLVYRVAKAIVEP
jgi:transcriptional regulator with XRE-family HTH domain